MITSKKFWIETRKTASSAKVFIAASVALTLSGLGLIAAAAAPSRLGFAADSPAAVTPYKKWGPGKQHGGGRNPASLPALPPLVVTSPPRLPSEVSDPKVLLKEFLRAQAAETKDLERKQLQERKEFALGQESKHRQWLVQEQMDRKAFFIEHSDGHSRRKYIQAFITRRDLMSSNLKTEKIDLEKALLGELSALRQKESNSLKIFKEALARKEVPSLELWPEVK